MMTHPTLTSSVFVLSGRRRLPNRLEMARADTPHLPGYPPDVVSTAAGRYGVNLYTRSTPRTFEATP